MAAASLEEPPKEEKCTPAAAAPSPTGAARPSPSGSHDEIVAVARKYADSPILNPDQGVWALLTAISKNARQRSQGMNIILNGDEHCIGRQAETRFQIADVAISGMHCRIYRKRLDCSDEAASDLCMPAFIKDTSTNGTFLNWKKLRKCSPETRLEHGDIISFIAPPHEDRAYAFVYREVSKSKCSTTGLNLKRKLEEFGGENKRTKGIGIGAADGPVSLDDVRSLQRSNTELRKQLESHVITIEALRSENREMCIRHENEVKELKESISMSYTKQITELEAALDIKHTEVNGAETTISELMNTIKDLNERLDASAQSRSEADEIIHSQKARISDLEVQLDEERTQRKEEREKSAADLKSALQRVQAEAQDEIRRQVEIYSRQHKEKEEVISKLQDSEKESRALLDTLRSKLEDTRENLVLSEKRVRQLEKQVNEEQTVSTNYRKKEEDAVLEFKRLRKELEIEKLAREEAWAKVSALELEIRSAMHELSIEKQRFQGARERIILRETQLRTFYSTTEEISALFTKQQEQLKAMRKTLEDEENCENTSIGFDLSPCPKEKITEIMGAKGERSSWRNGTSYVPQGDAPSTSAAKGARVVGVSSSDDNSPTEKHDCEMGTQGEDNNTQELECTSVSKSIRGFGSDIYGVGVPQDPDGELLDTEQVPETESPGHDVSLDGQGIFLQRCSNLAGETMQLDDDVQLQDNIEKPEKPIDINFHPSSKIEDTEAETIRTEDLLTSEVPASWANGTAPSVHGENESPRNLDSCDPGRGAYLTDGQADESQTNVATSGTVRFSDERLALNAMIEIVAPDFKQQFQTEQDKEKNDSLSDAETEEGSNETDSGDDGSGGGDDMIESPGLQLLSEVASSVPLQHL